MSGFFYSRGFATRLSICFAAAVFVLAIPLRAAAQSESAFHELETKYLFGNFTVGSSIGIEGEKAIEPDTQANFGKRGGRYGASQTELEFEYTPNQYVEIELGPTISYHNINGVPGLADRNTGAINGFGGDFRFLLVERNPSPFAVTLSVEPEWHSRDETSGVPVSNYGLETKLEADAEIVKNRLFLAFNVLYEPEGTNSFPGWTNESTFGASSALAFQIIPNVVIGADLWYLRHYQGLGFNSYTGDAVYVGPTFFWKISSKVLMSASWEAQVAGHEVSVASAFDLTDFSRQRARLLLEFEF
jgi:hypothetical protein